MRMEGTVKKLAETFQIPESNSSALHLEQRIPE